jgi:hypothetical protein
MALTLLSLGSLAQTEDSHSATGLPLTTSIPADSIAAARCSYAPGEEACAGLVDSNQADRSANADSTVSQFRRRPPGPPMRRGPMAYPQSYAPGGMASARHVAIGAAIGFGIGAAIGAKVGRGQPAGVTIKASALFGVLGAAVGAGIASRPPFPARGWSRNRPHRGRPGHKRLDDEDEMASVSKAAETP